MKIVLATNNVGKILELQKALAPLQMEVVPQAEFGIEDADETGLTFVENALIKARHAARLSGLPALADDSGLAVAALKGAPGIYSARYAGVGAKSSENIKKLLTALKDVPDDLRQASFHCVLAFVSHENDPTPLICDGIWRGTIMHAPSGGDGFGYDPVFFVPEKNLTAAELSIDIKNAISHRGKAVQSLLKLLPDKLHECALC